MSNASNVNSDSKRELKAGTGFMLDLSEAIRTFEQKGYRENFLAHHDHMSCRSGKVLVRPDEMRVDEIVRFENASDPADQSILYAISVSRQNIKGLYVESYGIYNEGLSPEMMKALTSPSEPSADLN